jgi:hypothetical protein
VPPIIGHIDVRVGKVQDGQHTIPSMTRLRIVSRGYAQLG